MADRGELKQAAQSLSPMDRLAAKRASLSPELQDYARELAITIDYRVRLRQLRRALGLTQVEAAVIAEVDQADISKIENGSLSPSIDRMNRILQRLGAYAEAQHEPKVEPRAARTITNASNAAKFLRAIYREGDSFSQLKLQKLLYYAQGAALVLFQRPLFTEPIQAWERGPVVPQIWQEYTEYHDSVLPRPEGYDPTVLPADARYVLEGVYSDYGQFDAGELIDMTHDEQPWKDAWNETTRNEVITDESLFAFFSTKLRH
jgi:uncharacterized phage-associated protein